VQDTRRHGVKVLPSDVTLSDWESTFERRDEEARRISPDETRLHRLGELATTSRDFH
jgi:error-prone DNA polymerase